MFTYPNFFLNLREIIRNYLNKSFLNFNFDIILDIITIREIPESYNSQKKLWIGFHGSSFSNLWFMQSSSKI